jgi:hypothetical protein
MPLTDTAPVDTTRVLTRIAPRHRTARAASPESHRTLATTRELPAIPETRPVREWSPSALDRLLADVMAVGR